MKKTKIKALALINDEGDRYTLAAFGTKPDKETVKKIIAAYNLMFQEDDTAAELNKLVDSLIKNKTAYHDGDRYYFETVTLYQ